MEVDCRLEVFGISKTASHALDFLNLAVEPLTHRFRYRMLVVGHDVGDVPPPRHAPRNRKDVKHQAWGLS